MYTLQKIECPETFEAKAYPQDYALLVAIATKLLRDEKFDQDAYIDCQDDALNEIDYDIFERVKGKMLKSLAPIFGVDFTEIFVDHAVNDATVY